MEIKRDVRLSWNNAKKPLTLALSQQERELEMLGKPFSLGRRVGMRVN
jgi:hypothetical protein